MNTLTESPRQLKEPQMAFEFDARVLDDIPIDARFDVEFANQLAEREAFNKHLYRPNSYLHKWWARRCGTTFRAILKHLVHDQTKLDYYAPGGLEGQIILDPMMGGGTTLHEAVRLGANVIGADIDPIPILQVRATLTKTSLPTLRRAFSDYDAALRAELAGLYGTCCPTCGASSELRFVLHAARKACSCGEALFVDSYTLRHNADGSTISIDPASYAVFHDVTMLSQNPSPPLLPLYEKTTQRCACGEKFVELIDTPFYQRYTPVAVAGECAEHGFFFAAPQATDLAQIKQADALRSELALVASDFAVLPGPKSSDLLKRGIACYLDLFSSRQLLFFASAMRLLADVETTVQLKFALLLSTATEFNALLCGYKGAGKNRPGAVRHTFAQHGYAFPYTALENNPLAASRSSGTLKNLFESRLVRGAEWAERPVERVIRGDKLSEVVIAGEEDAGQEHFAFSDLNTGAQRFLLLQGSSVSLDLPDNSIDHIVTDPPYFDSVQYSDLAAYFRVWLRKFVRQGVNWDYSLDSAAVNQQVANNGQYATILAGIFAECHRVLKKDHGRLIFTFHHWNPQGWAALTTALQAAGFRLVNRYVIHAENPSSVHIVNQNALVHDVVLVLSSRTSLADRTAWPLPERVDKTSSYLFCEQCGAALGYMLRDKLTHEEIGLFWAKLLS